MTRLLRLFTIVGFTFACASDSSNPGPDAALVPFASAGDAAVYHDRLGGIVLVNAGLGSMQDASHANRPIRLWLWKGTRWELIDSLGPSARNMAGVAYDPLRDALVMHGGTFSASRNFGETWEWRGNTWHLIATPGPGVQHHTKAVWDDSLKAVVLYGGTDGANNAITAVWAYNGTWRRIDPQNGPPRIHNTLVYDQHGKQLVVIAGVQMPGGQTGDAWAWNHGSQWQQRNELNTTARTHSAGTYDAARNAILLFGGFSGGALTGDLLRFDGSAWTRYAGASPPARYLPAFAFDRMRGVAVLFGGGDAGDGLLSDTWEWNGTTWGQR